jgi:drug/metabolite transporter (DMT)-like permease
VLPRRFLARLALALAVFCWGSQFVAVRFDVTDGSGIDALSLTAMRFAVGGLFFAPLAWRWGFLRDACGLGWRRAFILFMLAGAPYALLLMGALQLTPATHAAAINPGTVCAVSVLLPWALGDERFSRQALLGVAIVLVGLVLVTGLLDASFTPLVLLGDLLVFASGCIWAVYIRLIRRWRVDPWRATAAIVTLSAVYGWTYFLISGLPDVPVWRIAWLAVYQGVLLGVVVAAVYAWAVSVLGPREPATWSPLIPIIALITAIAVLGEELTMLQLTGILLVVGGVLTTNLAASLPKESSSGTPLP